MRSKKILVLCMTYGEPAENVFGPQYEYSLSILNRLTRRVAPIPRFITPLLAARRARIRCQMFNEMGYHSPLEPISEAQAQAIKASLEEKRPDVDFDVRVVTEFRRPFLPEVLKEFRNNPPDEIVILPLYVAESDFTTGISRTDLATFHQQNRGHKLPGPAYVGGFGFEERIGKVMADFVWKQCLDAGWTEEKARNAALILGAHGTLQYPPEGINSGARETLFLFGLIRKHLKDKFRTVRIAWLNHTLGGKWTFPAADETGQECWDQGIREIVYFPFGFFGDNNESQNEGKLALQDFDWGEQIYLPCPNEDPALCRLLADMTLERLDESMREDWDRIEHGGRRDLIQKVRPAIAGKPGLLKFRAPILGAVALFFWTMAGTMLLIRGYRQSQGIEDVATLAIVAGCSLLIGYFKGDKILSRVVIKNLKRLRRLPQPSAAYNCFSRTTWIIIACMIGLGITLRTIGLPPALYTTILWGVGLALLYGAVSGLMSLGEARPRGIVTMDGLISIEAGKKKPATGA